MSKSSSKPMRIVFKYFPVVEGERYLVFYSSGAIRSYRILPDVVSERLSIGPAVMWADGDALVYDLV